MPKKFEVWFINTSASKQTSQILDKLERYKLGPMVVENKRQCQPMGDYCFDPQYGLYKMEGDSVQNVNDYTNLDSKENYDDFDEGAGVDRDLINCDKGNFFDLYCGKAKSRGKQVKAKISMWIDVSATMKQVDFDGYESQCKRESMLRRLNMTCKFGSELKVHIFNESKKELGMMDRVCLNSGLNRTDRIMKDIKLSNVDHLIVITDIFEATEEFVEFIEAQKEGSHKGVDSPFFAQDLKEQVPRLAKACK